MAYGPLCVPIALRCSGCSSVATTAPRTFGSAWPHTSGCGDAEYCLGCVVSTTRRRSSPTPLSCDERRRSSSEGSRLGEGALGEPASRSSVRLRLGEPTAPFGSDAARAFDSTAAFLGTKRCGSPVTSTILMPAASTAAT